MKAQVASSPGAVPNLGARRIHTMEAFRSPHELQDGMAFVDAHSQALAWTCGLFSHWHWVQPQIAKAWRFFAFRRHGTLEALALHLDRSRWWGLIAKNPSAALEAGARISTLGSIRWLEGDENCIAPLIEADPFLRRRLFQIDRSLVLRCQPWSPPAPRSEFRLARRGDAKTLLAYFRENPGFSPIPSLKDLYVQIALKTFYVVEAEGGVVSLARAMPAGSRIYISDVYTFPEARGRGYARALMEGILWCLTKAGEEACLCVASSNEPAIRLYRSLGFVKWGDRLQVELRSV